VLPSATVAVTGDTTRVMAGIMATGIEADFVGSARGVALIWTVAGEGAMVGAVYAPLEEIVPQAIPEHPVPETFHKTVLLGFELETGTRVAVKFEVDPALTDEGPLKVSENELVNVTDALALLVGSATLTARMVTPDGDVRV
jgi:hypothetical protein